MPTVDVIGIDGQKVGEVALADEVFASRIHVPAMHQVVVAYLAAQRQGTHSTKTRGEVRGGGRKPWRQKHTGRARQGSIRSPLWIKGGVAHGPKPRSYDQKVNKKVRRLAMRSALSLKLKENKLLLVEGIESLSYKTKDMCAFLANVNAQDKPLMVIHESMPSVYMASQNIPGMKVLHVDGINVYEILNHEHLILTKDAAQRLEEVYSA
ncbi:MAG TPA: 50S ribosomal protein L4 [Acetomicrobium flavidum]|uniref:Large ribosomal subunit protein uL4 n=2 Tax=Acetomicrobium flavidum TaxID=49896 RepID=A0ABY1JBW6_9BACT|nr:LSU ribosomal protein L4P [Acetomicrobium flavidum]HOP88043.1 50S ribosomal protein L4 [Acetomicrobium flavidum]HPU69066.1 50S ribosomal protein L4 [Acetomicrobium flavidum]